MNKFVALSKRIKKEQKEFFASQRVTVNFNCGERVMKTAKHPTRAMRKAADRKEMY